MDYIGLVLEIVFLVLGVYVYLFAIGKTKASDPDVQAKAEAFRNSNGWWLRMTALALVAIMLVNIVVHLRQLFQA